MLEYSINLKSCGGKRRISKRNLRSLNNWIKIEHGVKLDRNNFSKCILEIIKSFEFQTRNIFSSFENNLDSQRYKYITQTKINVFQNKLSNYKKQKILFPNKN